MLTVSGQFAGDAKAAQQGECLVDSHGDEAGLFCQMPGIKNGLGKQFVVQAQSRACGAAKSLNAGTVF